MKGRKEGERKGQYDAHPVVELRTRLARNRVIRSGGDVRGVASFHEASEVGVHQNWSRQSTGRAIRSSRPLLSRVETRRQDGSMARFECDSDASALFEGCKK